MKFTQNNRSDRMMDDLPPRFPVNRRRRNSVATASGIHAEVGARALEAYSLEVATGDNQNILVSRKPLFEKPIPKTNSLKSCLRVKVYRIQKSWKKIFSTCIFYY